MMHVIPAVMVALALEAPAPDPQRPAVEIRVVDDFNVPVASTLRKVAKDEHEHLVGEADDGVFHLAEPCGPGERLVIKAKSQTGYYPKREFCPLRGTPARIVVSRVAVVEKMLRHAERAAAKENFAEAALVYNDVWARTYPSEPAAALDARAKSIEYMAKALEVAAPVTTDPLQGEIPVLSPEMKLAIIDFQKKNNLKPTGDVNYRTLATAAGTDIARILATARD